MQNTKTEYSSSERTPVVLPEMEQLLPPLSGEQFSSLESDILENGCYAPIIVNEDMAVIDGQQSFSHLQKTQSALQNAGAFVHRSAGSEVAGAGHPEGPPQPG